MIEEQYLIRQIKSGSQNALETAIDRYGSYVKAIAANIIKPPMTDADIEEVVSDVFLSLWNHPGDPGRGSLKGYLAATATVGTAFASGIFVMHKQHASPGETEKRSDVILVNDQTGETETEEYVLRDVAVSFTFTGEDTPNEVWVHPDYLPKEPEQLNQDLMIEGEPGWYQYLSGESGFTDPIPWQISVHYALADTKLVLLGEIETEAETDWDGLQVTEITLSRAEGVSENYVILFDPDAGYMIIVAGMSDMGELEKIAKGLDIRVTDTPVSTSRLYTGFSTIKLGRG